MTKKACMVLNNCSYLFFHRFLSIFHHSDSFGQSPHFDSTVSKKYKDLGYEILLSTR